MKDKKKMKKNVKVRKSVRERSLSVLRFLTFFVVPACAIAGVMYFASTHARMAFPLETVAFSGNRHLTEEELVQMAGLRRNQSLLSLSPREVHDSMIRSPWIRSVSVRKSFPNSLEIMVREAEPFALLDMKGQLFIIDDEGNMLEELRETRIPFLPVITGTTFGNTKAFREALELTRAVRERGLDSKKEHIEIVAASANDLAVNLDGIVVKVGEGDYEDKIMRLASLENEIVDRDIRIDYIDLRFAKRAVVKPMKEVIQ